jgi:hypothetical protein
MHIDEARILTVSKKIVMLRIKGIDKQSGIITPEILLVPIYHREMGWILLEMLEAYILADTLTTLETASNLNVNLNLK